MQPNIQKGRQRASNFEHTSNATQKECNSLLLSVAFLFFHSSLPDAQTQFVQNNCNLANTFRV